MWRKCEETLLFIVFFHVNAPRCFLSAHIHWLFEQCAAFFLEFLDLFQQIFDRRSEIGSLTIHTKNILSSVSPEAFSDLSWYYHSVFISIFFKTCHAEEYHPMKHQFRRTIIIQDNQVLNYS